MTKINKKLHHDCQIVPSKCGAVHSVIRGPHSNNSQAVQKNNQDDERDHIFN